MSTPNQDAADTAASPHTGEHDAKELDGAVSHTADGRRSAPHTPADRDEAAGMSDGKPDPVIRQGHHDQERGLEDTSSAAETDAAYDKLKKPKR